MLQRKRSRWQALAIVLVFAPFTAFAQSITSGNYRLTFPPEGQHAFGIYIAAFDGSAAPVASTEPVQIFVCTSCSDETTDQTAIPSAYSSLTQNSAHSVLATAVVTTPNGSIFNIEDLYASGLKDGTFTVSRTVTVAHANDADVGFNSQFILGFASPTAIQNYHFLAPGIWYDKNSNVISGAFASNYSNNYFYWRETRTGLPFVMMQDPSTGTALSLAHIDATPSSGSDETNQSWVVNSSIQYGSIGAQRVPQMDLGFIYPADEGDGNYVGNRSLLWTRRSHPVTEGFSHAYTLAIHVGQYRLQNGSANFRAALKNTWRFYYDLFAPAIADVPSAAVYSDGINLLNHYSANRDGAQGFPFSSLLPDGSIPPSQISYLMGFVGEQIPAGYQMVRYGLLNGNGPILADGIATLDFWAHNADQANGLPLTWYNVDPPTFRDDDCYFPIFLRTASDGMEGMLDAAILMRKYNQPQVDWERFVTSFGDWLSKNQNADGSFYRAFNPDGSVFTNASGGCDANGYGTSKSDTTHPVRFLVTLYFATGEKKYLNSAIAAGNYAYVNSFKTNSYVGGTPDNGNTIDKEAGVEALHAYLALYDATHDSRWLRAAKAAADYTETWMYAWNFPIAAAPPAFTYAGTQGSSLIATGQSGSDIFLSFEVYDFYRLHLLTDDDSNHYLHIAEYLANNTKLTTQVTGIYTQNFGYSVNGLVGEAEDLSFMAYQGGASAGSWLPWLTEAEIEPLQQLQDTFGSDSISAIEAEPLQKRLAQNQNAYPRPGSIRWGDGLGVSNPGFELPGISTNSIPGWSVYTPDNGASANAAFTETYGQSHNGSWHLAEYKPTPYALSTYQDVHVPNGDYEVTAWVECSGGQPDAHMEIHNNLSPDVFSKVNGCLSSTSYQPISLNIPVTTGLFTIGFYSYDPVGGHWLRVDDISVLSNPGFEYPGAVVSPPPGWSVSTGMTGTQLSSVYTETYGDSHSGSWHMTEYQTTPYDITAYQDLLVSDGPHTVSAWVECSSSNLNSQMKLSGYISPDKAISTDACSDLSGYHQIKEMVNVSTGKLRIGFHTHDAEGAKWLRVDDVSIR